MPYLRVLEIYIVIFGFVHLRWHQLVASAENMERGEKTEDWN